MQILADDDEDVVKSGANFLAYMFIAIGFVAGLGTLLQTYMFNTAGVKMTSRLRNMTFQTLLKQEIGYFDDEKNSVGALCARLAGDCSNVQGVSECIIIDLVYQKQDAKITDEIRSVTLFALFIEAIPLLDSNKGLGLANRSRSVEFSKEP